eukprot:TRINITY_DN27201_c0_g1_i1.p1 TRINITY_DN27201_c0_g1~~TRINITY_DN27201_c0_g1_i1.p1  ORF type:complete len:466 (+),score=39.44 TRINITY_DN27201_c0_g1_i1:97-1494(+)
MELTTITRIFGGLIFVLAYVLLYVGLFGDLVFYEHEVAFDAKWFDDEPPELANTVVNVIQQFLGTKPITIIPPKTRSLVGDRPGSDGLLRILLDKAKNHECSYVAPGILIFFGIVLPLLKMAVMIIQVGAPDKCGPSWLRLSSWFSRWTAVDAVAEAMIVALLLIGGVVAEHRQGYVAFVGYCLFSTVGSWMLDNGHTHDERDKVAYIMTKMQWKSVISPYVSVLTLVLFLATFAFGACVFPVARIWVPEVVVSSSLDMLVKPYAPLLTALGQESLLGRLRQDILTNIPVPSGEGTLVQAAGALLFSGHTYTVFGSMVLFAGVVACPVVHACCACYLVHRAQHRHHADTFVPEEETSLIKPEKGCVLAIADFATGILKASGDLSLLDVYVVGMFAAAVVLASLDKVLQCDLLSGFYSLVIAVLIGYIHQLICSASIISFEKGQADESHTPMGLYNDCVADSDAAE